MLHIIRVAELPAKGSPFPGSQHLTGAWKGVRQAESTERVIVVPKGQASSCWAAKQPPFVHRANTEDMRPWER